MKKLLVSVLLGMALVPAGMANGIWTVGGYGPYQTGTGGEFTFMTDSGSSWILNQGYVDNVGAAPGTRNIFQAGTFQTFCAEHGNYVYPGEYNIYGVSQGTINSGKTLTKGAAWLYHEFQNGTLQYDYTRTTPGQVQDLQNALWYFLSEVPNANNYYVAMANTALGTAANALSPNNGEIGVAILNLTTPNGDVRQDMFVCVPDGGMTLMLLGMGLSSLSLVARRLRS